MLDGSKILREIWGTNELMPIYDNEESVSGIIYNGTSYYFQKNLQGDVIELVDEEAEVVARYTYDAWGKVTGVRDKNGNAITDATHVAHINPFRYRGYYFDAEIGLYYLQSRYYDPVVGRFVNADEATLAGTTLNIFVYCNNAPVVMTDSQGFAAQTYSGIVGFGIQFVLTANVLCYQGFLGAELIWFAPKDNFGNGIMPWFYWFRGGSFGITLDFEKLLSPKLLSNPKNVIEGFGMNFAFSFSITFFLITAEALSSPIDYEGNVSLWSGTTMGVTISKAWGNGITTYGIGISFEVGKKGLRLTLGRKLFGFTSGEAIYRLLPFLMTKDAKALYDLAKGKV